MIKYKVTYNNDLPGKHIEFFNDYDKAIACYYKLIDRITTSYADIIKVNWNIEKGGYTNIIEVIGMYS